MYPPGGPPPGPGPYGPPPGQPPMPPPQGPYGPPPGQAPMPQQPPMPQQQPGPHWQPGPHQQYPPGPHQQQFPPGPPMPPNQAPRKPGPGRWIALAAIVVVVVAGTIVGVNYFGGNDSADAAGGGDDAAGEQEAEGAELLLTSVEEVPAASYGGTPVYDACALAPVEDVVALGFDNGLTGTRIALDTDVPADAALDHGSDAEVSSCRYKLLDRPIDYIDIAVFQAPYVDSADIENWSQAGDSHDYGSGLTGVTWNGIGVEDADEYHFLVQRDDVVVEGKMYVALGEDGRSRDAEAMETARAQLAELIAENLTEDPVRGRHGHAGYDDVAAPCELLSPDVFATIYGTNFSAPVEEIHHGEEQVQLDTLEMQYVESECTRETDQGPGTLLSEVDDAHLRLEHHHSEESAGRVMSRYCGPEESHPVENEPGDAACLTEWAQFEGLGLAIRVGTNTMVLSTSDSSELTEPAEIAETLVPIGELIVAGM